MSVQSMFVRHLGETKDLFPLAQYQVGRFQTLHRGMDLNLTSLGLQNLILYSGSIATTLNDVPRLHAKNDNPSWSYRGRSYGVGSSIGIYDGAIDATGGRMNFSYTESGYVANTACFYNGTSDFTLFDSGSVSPTNSSLSLTTFTASGSLPNLGDFFYFPVVLTNQSTIDGVLTWVASYENDRSMLSIASNGYYDAFDTLQCEVQWSPTLFHVDVNVTNQTIMIQPQDTPANPPGNESDFLISNVMASLGLIAQTTASIAYEPLGQALYTNWGTYNETFFSGNLTSSYNSSGDNATIPGSASPAHAVEASIDAMIDDILVGFGAAQLYWNIGNNGTNTTSGSSTYLAVRLGEDAYIYATLAINILLIIVGVEEALRTRFWHHLSPLDYLDLKSIIVAASAGGTEIAEECRQRHGTNSKWRGDSGSKEVAGIRVELIERVEAEEGEGLAMVLAGSRSGKEDGSEDNESRSLTDRENEMRQVA